MRDSIHSCLSNRTNCTINSSFYLVVFEIQHFSVTSPLPPRSFCIPEVSVTSDWVPNDKEMRNKGVKGLIHSMILPSWLYLMFISYVNITTNWFIWLILENAFVLNNGSSWTSNVFNLFCSIYLLIHFICVGVTVSKGITTAFWWLCFA